MKQQVAARMQAICQAEGLQVNQAAMDEIFARADGDLRCIIGYLMNARLRCKSLTYDDVSKSYATDQLKDADISPFSAVQKLLDPSSAQLSLMDHIELGFVDDLVPLLLQVGWSLRDSG